METNGLNVGENQTNLLQKVEELTLYLIAADERTKSDKAIIVRQRNTETYQQKQLKVQQEEIEQLKQQMKKVAESINKK